jgi:magnesium transporter
MLSRYTQRNLTWVDCVSPTPAEVKGLIAEFGVDPLIAEELLLPSYKPKVEKRGDVAYVILHFPILHNAHQKHEQEIDFIIGKNFLITTRYITLDPLHSFAKAFAADAVLSPTGSATHGGHLFVLLATNLYTALLGECDSLERKLRDIEEHIFAGEERSMVARLSHVGRLIHDFRQSILSHHEMLSSFDPVGARLFGPEFAYHVHSLMGSYERIVHRLDNLRDSLSELRETNNSLLSTKQNEIMKTLTVLAFVFLPLTFITGLFSMDTKHSPIVGSAYDFWIILAGMAIIAGGCFLYFRHKDWL